MLPGIGKFTVVDGSRVAAADLGNNFFVGEGAVGSGRAAAVTALLQELNEHVTGAYVSEGIGKVLSDRPSFLDDFTLVIATQLPLEELRQVAAVCSAQRIPLIAAHAYGLLGTVRVMLNEHPVVEAHPQHPVADLRVLAPPPALLAYIEAHFGDLSALSSAQYAHVPYVVLLIKAAAAWSLPRHFLDTS